MLKRRTLFFRRVIVQFNTDITLSLKSLARSESTLLIIIFCFSKEIVLCVVDFFRQGRETNNASLKLLARALGLACTVVHANDKWHLTYAVLT